MESFNGQPPPWAPKRERFREPKHLSDAIALADTFPINTPFTVEEFDLWASTRNRYAIPQDSDKQGDAWKATLQRRHELIQGINRASETQDMLSHGGAYALVNERGGKLQRISPEQHIAHPSLSMRKLKSLLTTKRAQLEHALRAEDFTAKHPYVKALYVKLYRQIENFETHIKGQVEVLDTEFYGLLELAQTMGRDPILSLTMGSFPLEHSPSHSMTVVSSETSAPQDEEEPFC
jgi:hypothetical protein